jgi:spermidine synthase
MPSSWVTGICNFAFFLSGFAALVYELSWSRQLGQLLGHTPHAAGVVLGSLFLGMSVGYGQGARLTRHVSPLLGYSLAEFAVALWAMLIPQALQLAQDYIGSSGSPSQLTSALHTGFCFVLLLPGAVALGLTLPTMAAFLSRSDKRRIVTAYGWNLAGAFLGVASATLTLLVEVGIVGSSYLAAVVSATAGLIGVIVLAIYGTGRLNQESDLAELNRTDPARILKSGQSHTSDRVPGVYAALFGFGTLACQVLYLRLFSLVFHNSTYTFGAVAAAFLAALAIGAAFAGWLSRLIAAKALLPWMALMSSFAVLASLFVFLTTTGLEYMVSTGSFAAYLGQSAVLVGVVVVPFGTVCGTLLPLLWTAPGTTTDAAAQVGRLGMLNSLGAAAGSVAAGGLLLPWFGLWGSFIVVCTLFAVISATEFYRLKQRGMAALTAFSILVFALTSWSVLREWLQPASLRQEAIVRRWESRHGWIDLVRDRDTGELKIRQNLHYRLGATGARHVRERRQAHIPLLLHPQPKNVLLLGQGTGITAAGALQFDGVQRVTIVELVPEVVEAARRLGEHNSEIFDDPRATIEVDDARHFLRKTTAQYDVIISDLFVPWESQSGYLYTVDHYEVARSRLTDRGLFCQWLPLYQLGKQDFEMIADSFATTFPFTTLWWGQLDGNQAILALVGTEKPLSVDPTVVHQRISAMDRRTADPLLVNGTQLFDLSAGWWRMSPDTPLNTDEHPRLEFTAPRSHGDRRLLMGAALEKYFDSSLSDLDDPFRVQSGRAQAAMHDRRAFQHFLLFGD